MSLSKSYFSKHGQQITLAQGSTPGKAGDIEKNVRTYLLMTNAKSKAISLKLKLNNASTLQK